MWIITLVKAQTVANSPFEIPSPAFFVIMVHQIAAQECLGLIVILIFEKKVNPLELFYSPFTTLQPDFDGNLEWSYIRMNLISKK